MDPDRPIDRRKALKVLGAAAGSTALLPLAACGKNERLTFANWDNYLGETTLADFKSASGIDTAISLIQSEDALFAQLRKGDNPPDLVIASNRIVERLIEAELVAPLKQSSLPNLHNLDPFLADPPYDRGGRYSVPYTWLVEGIGFRRSALAAAPRGWADLFSNPAHAGRIALPSDPSSLMRIAARAQRRDPGKLSQADIPALAGLLQSQIGRIKSFADDGRQDLLLGKQVDLAAGYNGDIAQVILEDPDIGFVFPEEGSEISVDCLCIARGASNLPGALQFIDFILTGQAGAGIAETILFPTPNLAAKALMADQYQASPVLFPAREQLARCQFTRWNSGLERAMAEAWRRIYPAR